MGMEHQLIINRDDLAKANIDIGGRDLFIGFSEPAFRVEEASVNDAPLNARLISYFLPAVQIARMQKTKRRPRLWIISAIQAAVKWNANSDAERLIMTMDNNLKKDFILSAFNKFFPDVFSLIDIRDTVDFLKISGKTLSHLWGLFRQNYPDKIIEIEKHLQRFRQDAATSEQLFQYALVHLFAFGDINFDWYAHNPRGYCSIGEHNERIFNKVREIGLELLRNNAEQIFDRSVSFFDNMKIVIDSPEKLPPPYNGAHRTLDGKTDLDEVTYENGRSLDYYDDRPRHKTIMEYVYSLIPRDEYEAFWKVYRPRYDDLKQRHLEAYEIR